jgi:hypothetical protein
MSTQTFLPHDILGTRKNAELFFIDIPMWTKRQSWKEGTKINIPPRNKGFHKIMDLIWLKDEKMERISPCDTGVYSKLLCLYNTKSEGLIDLEYNLSKLKFRFGWGQQPKLRMHDFHNSFVRLEKAQLIKIKAREKDV